MKNHTGTTTRRSTTAITRIGVALAATVGSLAVGGVTPATAAYGPGPGDEVSRHRAYVAIATNEPLQSTDATVLGVIDDALERWEVEAGGGLVFERAGVTRRFALTQCGDRSAARSQAKALFPGVEFGGDTGNHIIVVSTPACFGSSSAVNGNGLGDAGSGVAYAYTVDKGTQTLLHEVGHNFGLHHAYAMRCTANGECEPEKYKNHYSPMGSTLTGTPAWVPGSFDSFEFGRLELDHAAGLRSVVLPTDRRVRTTTVDLHGRGTDLGDRGVRVVDPVDGTTYFLDFRSGAGRDAGAWYPTSRPRDEFHYNRGLTIGEQTVIDGDAVTVLQTFRQDDGTGYQYAKTAGQVFERGGVRIEVAEMDLTRSVQDIARLRITLTDPDVPLSDQTEGALDVTARAAVGSTITATPVDWPSDVTLGPIQWYDEGTPIDGATGPSYVVPPGSDGHRLTARVTGSRESFRDRIVESRAVVIGADILEHDGRYRIGRLDTGQVVTNPGSTSNSTQMTIAAPADTTGQQWIVRVNADGTFRLENVHSGRCLDNAASSRSAGARIIQWSCHESDNQRWKLIGNGAGYELENKASGLRLTAVGTLDGSVLTQETDHQVWGFSRLG